MPRTVSVLALLVLVSLLLGLDPARRDGPEAGSPPLVVLATASNRGEVEPCG
jgi:hypothetical protein